MKLAAILLLTVGTIGFGSIPAQAQQKDRSLLFYRDGYDVLKDCQTLLAVRKAKSKVSNEDVTNAGKCAGELMAAVDMMVAEADAFAAANLPLFCAPDVSTEVLAAKYVEYYPVLYKSGLRNGQQAIRAAFAIAFPCRPGVKPNGKRISPPAVCPEEQGVCG